MVAAGVLSARSVILMMIFFLAVPAEVDGVDLALVSLDELELAFVMVDRWCGSVGKRSVGVVSAKAGKRICSFLRC